MNTPAHPLALFGFSATMARVAADPEGNAKQGLRFELQRVLSSTTGAPARAAIVAATGRRGVLVEGLTREERGSVWALVGRGVKED